MWKTNSSSYNCIPAPAGNSCPRKRTINGVEQDTQDAIGYCVSNLNMFAFVQNATNSFYSAREMISLTIPLTCPTCHARTQTVVLQDALVAHPGWPFVRRETCSKCTWLSALIETKLSGAYPRPWSSKLGGKICLYLFSYCFFTHVINTQPQSSSRRFVASNAVFKRFILS